ncbi:MAG: OFA family MFS transporter [Dorea sp.]|nr:OFA family MFS transporter [Dorea sp.]
MNLSKKRWLVLIASCLINLCIGSLYAWSVFAAPMAEYIGALKGISLTASSLAIVFTVANSVGPVTMISGGKLNEILGTRMVVLIGGLMFGGGMFVSGFATDKTLLIIGYGLLTGLGMGAAYGCTITNTVKFFPDKKGLIGGIATASYGLSSVLMPPVANKLIDSAGVASAFKIIGIVFMILIAVCSFFIEKCPDGFVPDGYETAGQGARASAPATADKNWKEMLASPVFYVMILMMTCGAFSGMMCISQTSNIAQKNIGLTPATAALMVSLLALFNAAGRVGAGYISDRIGRVATLRIALVLSLAGLGILYLCQTGQTTLFIAGIACIGMSFGSFMGVYPGFTSEQFGSRYNGVNYGIMFIGFAFAGCFGPTVMGKILGATGSYAMAFVVAGIITVCGLLLSFAYDRLS